MSHGFLNWALPLVIFTLPSLLLLIDMPKESVAGSCHCLIISISSPFEQKLGESSWKGQKWRSIPSQMEKIFTGSYTNWRPFLPLPSTWMPNMKVTALCNTCGICLNLDSCACRCTVTLPDKDKVHLHFGKCEPLCSKWVIKYICGTGHNWKRAYLSFFLTSLFWIKIKF